MYPKKPQNTTIKIYECCGQLSKLVVIFTFMDSSADKLKKL